MLSSYRLTDAKTGFTLVELLIVIAIIGILAAVAVPEIFGYLQEAKYAHAITDIESYYKESIKYHASNGEFPSDWSDLNYDAPPEDPWGNQYILNNHDDVPTGKLRKDGPVVPINENIDIYSKGPNGSSNPNIHSAPSRDDVILAAEGSFVGKAENF